MCRKGLKKYFSCKKYRSFSAKIGYADWICSIFFKLESFNEIICCSKACLSREKKKTLCVNIHPGHDIITFDSENISFKFGLLKMNILNGIHSAP